MKSIQKSVQQIVPLMACLFIVVHFVGATRTPGAGMIPLEPDLSQFYGLATSNAGNVTFAVTSKFVAVVPALPGQTPVVFKLSGVEILPHEDPVAIGTFLVTLARDATNPIAEPMILIFSYASDSLVEYDRIPNVAVHSDKYSGRFIAPCVELIDKILPIYPLLNDLFSLRFAKAENSTLVYFARHNRTDPTRCVFAKFDGSLSDLFDIENCASVAWITEVRSQELAFVTRDPANAKENLVTFSTATQTPVNYGPYDAVTCVEARAGVLFHSSKDSGNGFSKLEVDGSPALIAPFSDMYVAWRRLFYVNRDASKVYFMNSQDGVSNPSYGAHTVGSGTDDLSFSTPAGFGILSAFYQHPDQSYYYVVVCNKIQRCTLRVVASTDSSAVDLISDAVIFSAAFGSSTAFFFVADNGTHVAMYRQTGLNAASLVTVFGCSTSASPRAFVHTIAATNLPTGQGSGVVTVLPFQYLTFAYPDGSTSNPALDSPPLAVAPFWLLGATKSQVVAIRQSRLDSEQLAPVLVSTRINGFPFTSSIVPLLQSFNACQTYRVGPGGFFATGADTIASVRIGQGAPTDADVALLKIESATTSFQNLRSVMPPGVAFPQYSARTAGSAGSDGNPVFFPFFTLNVSQIVKFDPATANISYVLVDANAGACDWKSRASPIVVSSSGEDFIADDCNSNKILTVSGYQLHTSANFSSYNRGGKYAYLSAARQASLSDTATSQAFTFPYFETGGGTILGHPTRDFVAAIGPFLSGYRAIVASDTQVIFNQSLVQPPSAPTFIPVGWVSDCAIFLEMDLYASVPYTTVWSIQFSFASSQGSVIQLDSRTFSPFFLHGPISPPFSLQTFSCILNSASALMAIGFSDGHVYITDGYVIETLIQGGLPPLRWMYDTRMICLTEPRPRVYMELLDTNGLNMVYATAGSPCLTNLDCSTNRCNLTNHFCDEPSNLAPVGAPFGAPVGATPFVNPKFCSGPPPSPQFFCNTTLGVYQLNTTVGSTIVINGSLVFNSSVIIGANITLVVSQNLSISCTSNLQLSGSIIVNGSAQICGSIKLGTLQSGTSPLLVSECLSLNGTTISIDSTLVDTLLNTANGNKASTTVAEFGCKGLGETPIVTLVGQSARCQNLAASPELNDKSLGILFTGSGCDSSDNTSNLNVIALALGLSVAGLVLIVAVVLVIIPKTRHAIFPFTRKHHAADNLEME